MIKHRGAFIQYTVLGCGHRQKTIRTFDDKGILELGLLKEVFTATSICLQADNVPFPSYLIVWQVTKLIYVPIPVDISQTSQRVPSLQKYLATLRRQFPGMRRKWEMRVRSAKTADLKFHNLESFTSYFKILLAISAIFDSLYQIKNLEKPKGRNWQAIETTK